MTEAIPRPCGARAECFYFRRKKTRGERGTSERETIRSFFRLPELVGLGGRRLTAHLARFYRSPCAKICNRDSEYVNRSSGRSKHREKGARAPLFFQCLSRNRSNPIDRTREGNVFSLARSLALVAFPPSLHLLTGSLGGCGGGPAGHGAGHGVL